MAYRIQYVDEARRGNAHLLSAYRARMKRQEKEDTRTGLKRKADLTSMVQNKCLRIWTTLPLQ